MSLLSLIPGLSWIKITAVTLALVALAGLAWKWRHDAVVEAVAAERAVWVADLNRRVAAQLLQEQANRSKETELNQIIVKQRTDHAKDIERRNATALLVAGQLRDFQAIASEPRPAGQDSTASRVFDDARTTVINECSGAVTALDSDIERAKAKITGLQSYVTEVCRPSSTQSFQRVGG